MSFIQTTQLSKSYGEVVVLDDINVSIEKGSIVALIGPNGAGKSTLVKMLMGLIEPTSGEAFIDEKLPKQQRQMIGYVPQRFHIDANIPLTVKEFLRLSFCASGQHNHEEEKRIVERLEEVGLPDVIDKQVSQLSGGQLQRVLMARALMTKKEILILDEPVSGVDVEAKESIYALLKRLNQTHNMTIILISHELSVVYEHADHVWCINRKMLCYGKPKEALTDDVMSQMYDGHVQGYQHGCSHV